MTFAKSRRLRMTAVILLSVTSTALVTHLAEAAYSSVGQEALHRLQEARNDVAHAEGSGGGHFTNAIHLIDQAMEEVQAGLQH